MYTLIIHYLLFCWVYVWSISISEKFLYTEFVNIVISDHIIDDEHRINIGVLPLKILKPQEWRLFKGGIIHFWGNQVVITFQISNLKRKSN